MFGKKVKNKLKKIPKTNVCFLDTNKTISVSIQNHDINRLISFLNSFLEGITHVFCFHNSNCKLYIYGIELTTYNDLHEKVNARIYTYLPPVDDFNLPCKNDFFENCDYATVVLYVAFDKAHECGTIYNINVNFTK
mgnify:CR=1 FL=1